jgi:DNA-binding beta-propeller fold protein YncE
MSITLVRRACLTRWAGLLMGASVGISAPLAATASSPTWGSWGPVSIGETAVASDGTIFTSDCGNARIYRVRSDGSLAVFAGSGPGGFDNGYSGDGGPALDAHFGCPVGLLFDPAGNLLIVDHLNDAIRKIDRRGIVTTIAGRGPLFTWSHGPWVPGPSGRTGDGGPATEAVLDAPWRIWLDPAGNLFIADRDHDAIRKVDRSGIITTVAGTGQRGYGGDGGQAILARIDRPLDMTTDPSGRLVIADENNARLRRVDARGVITTIGGTGKLGCTADGARATAVPIQNPESVRVLDDGTVIFGSVECHTIRAIRPDGTLVRFAGTGTDGCSGLDGGLAVQADLSAPSGLTLLRNGELLVGDGGCNVILRIDRQGRSHIVADATSAPG